MAPQLGMDSTYNKSNDDFISFLEHKLDEIERKLQKTQTEYDNLQGDYVEL